MSLWSRLRGAFGVMPESDPGRRYCPKCGRERLYLAPLRGGATGAMWVPPNAWEQEHRCTQLSCEWFDEPSVADDPHIPYEKPRSPEDRLHDVEQWVQRSRQERESGPAGPSSS